MEAVVPHVPIRRTSYLEARCTCGAWMGWVQGYGATGVTTRLCGACAERLFRRIEEETG